MRTLYIIRMRRPLLAAVIAIQALAICRVEGAAMDRLSLLAPQPLGITAPTEGELAFLADHAIAMTQYRWMAEQGLSERGYRLRRRETARTRDVNAARRHGHAGVHGPMPSSMFKYPSAARSGAADADQSAASKTGRMIRAERKTEPSSLRL